MSEEAVFTDSAVEKLPELNRVVIASGLGWCGGLIETGTDGNMLSGDVMAQNFKTPRKIRPDKCWFL